MTRLFHSSAIFSHRDVQEVAVVRDQHERVRVGGEIAFQPVARFQIQVVGGLVEQQQVRLFEQQLGQRDAHLPAAGELFGAALPVALAETRGRRARRPTCASIVYPSRARNSPRRWWNRSATCPYSALAGSSSAMRCVSCSCSSSSAADRENGHAFGEDGAAGKRQALLRQVAAVRPFARQGAVVERIHAGRAS